MAAPDIKKGHFQRKNTPTEKRRRFLCKSCKSQFSQTSGSLDEGQKRPDLHHPIFMLLISGVSQRRAAKLCSTTQITVAVEEGSRIILSATAASMPAKGHLAALSQRHYGIRADHRKHSLGMALATISYVASADLLVKSDQCPRYPKLVRKHLPGAEHKTFKGRRRCGRLVCWRWPRQVQPCRAV